MNVKDIITIASSEYVFAILFIGFLWLVVQHVRGILVEQRESSKEREQYIFKMHEQQMTELKENMLHERNSSHELMVEQRQSFDMREQELLKHLNKNTDQLTSVADTLKDIQRNLSKLEDRVEDNFMEVWKELGGKQDKNRQ